MGQETTVTANVDAKIISVRTVVTHPPARRCGVGAELALRTVGPGAHLQALCHRAQRQPERGQKTKRTSRQRTI